MDSRQHCQMLLLKQNPMSQPSRLINSLSTPPENQMSKSSGPVTDLWIWNEKQVPATGVGTEEALTLEMKLQIDIAATCNAISELSLHTLNRNVAIQHSPYLLYPYGDARPIRPHGQIVLLCEREGRYETFPFQVVPNELMDDKPALLSGTECERLGLISINTGEVFSIKTRIMKETTWDPSPLAFKLIMIRKSTDVTHSSNGPKVKDDSDIHYEQMINKRLCNYVEELHATLASQCRPQPMPSRIPIHIPKSH